ncbi:hypothetical protein DMENIID0001_119750 [Sergentomyia squamirostris]
MRGKKVQSCGIVLLQSRHRKGVASSGVASRSVHRSRGVHCRMAVVDELQQMRPSRGNNSKLPPRPAVVHTSPMLGPKGGGDGVCGGRWNRSVAKVTLCGILCLMATMETCLAARQEGKGLKSVQVGYQSCY